MSTITTGTWNGVKSRKGEKYLSSSHEVPKWAGRGTSVKVEWSKGKERTKKGRESQYPENRHHQERYKHY